MDPSVFQRLEQFLQAHAVSYQVRRHEPVYTSEQAAAVRGTSLASGAKALICRTKDGFSMFVLPADRRLNSKQVRKLGMRDLRFASKEEVAQLTTLAPGSIPPFGSLFDLPTWCDQALSCQEQINFNAGDHSLSVSMTWADYLRVERPTLATIAE